MSSSTNTSAGTAFTITELIVPISLQSPDAADFIGMAGVRSAVESEQRGGPAVPSADPASVAAGLLPDWRNDGFPMWGIVAKVDGRVVARGNLALPIGAGECWGALSVLPEFRGRGIGGALFERLQQKALAEGRSIIQNQTSYPAGVGGESIQAPTGFGSVPVDLVSTRFLQRHGFTMEQVGRMSVLSLPVDPDVFDPLLAETVAAASGYRTVSWQGRTPEEWVDGMAMLHTRMSTDTPNAGIEQTEDVWTADRIRAFDELREDGPHILITSVAVHEASGELAGYTELNVPPEPELPAEQWDTLVIAGHRGHRLGMLLKLTNLRELTRRFPHSGSVETTNAEDNRHMLDVNEAVGFHPVAYSARWKKDVSGRPSQ